MCLHYRTVRSCDLWRECSTPLDSLYNIIKTGNESSIVDVPVYSIHDLRMRQVTLNLEGTARLLVCVFLSRSMKKSKQGSLFSFFKPVNKSCKDESSHQSPVPKTNGVKTAVRWIYMWSCFTNFIVCVQTTPVGRKRAAKKSPTDLEERRAPKRQKQLQSSDESSMYILHV